MLRTPVETRGEDLTTVADFEVEEGKTVPFVLTYGPSHLDPPEPINPAQALEDTEKFWTEWCSRCTYEGQYRDLVLRSLITLKALTFESDRRHRGRADHLAAGEIRRLRATGIIASAGCATPPSRCWR